MGISCVEPWSKCGADEGPFVLAQPLHIPHSRAQRRLRGEETLGPIDQACEYVLRNVDGAVLCGVVDLSSGIVLGGAGLGADQKGLNDALAAVSGDFFSCEDVSALRTFWGGEEAELGKSCVDEVDVATARAHHFAKSIKKGSAALLLVTDRTVNIGMGWAQMRSALPQLEPHVP